MYFNSMIRFSLGTDKKKPGKMHGMFWDMPSCHCELALKYFHRVKLKWHKHTRNATPLWNRLIFISTITILPINTNIPQTHCMIRKHINGLPKLLPTWFYEMMCCVLNVIYLYRNKLVQIKLCLKFYFQTQFDMTCNTDIKHISKPVKLPTKRSQFCVWTLQRLNHAI